VELHTKLLFDLQLPATLLDARPRASSSMLAAAHGTAALASPALEFFFF